MNLAEMLAMADEATANVEITSGSFEPVPAGVYEVAVTSAEGPKDSTRVNPQNPSEHGKYIKLELTLTSGQYANRKVWLNNNIIVYPKSMTEEDIRKAQTAMAMGAKERKVIFDSVGKVSIQDASELVGATFNVKLAVRTNSNGNLENEVKTVIAKGHAPVATRTIPAAAPAAPAAAPAAPARPKMPWEK